MVLQDLTLFLEQQGIGTRGTDIFYGNMPPTPDAVVVLYEYGGVSETDMGRGRIRAEYPMVQVAVRGARQDYDTPRTRIKAVLDAFATIGDTLVNGVTYGEVTPSGAVRDAGEDDNLRQIFTCNLRVMKDYV